MDEQFDYYLCIAGLPFHIHGLYDRITERFPAYYCAPTENAVEISVSREELEALRQSEKLEDDYPTRWIETALVREKICKYILPFRRMLIHGVCVTYGGKAYLITAPSGVGKTTHALLWRRYLGDAAQILNGDKPVVSFGTEIVAHGTPWMGKEHYGGNASAPLAGIVFLTRDTKCHITKITQKQAFPLLYNQIFFTDSRENIQYILDGIRRILSETPIYELHCDSSEQAVQCCFEALTGKRYKRNDDMGNAEQGQEIPSYQEDD